MTRIAVYICQLVVALIPVVAYAQSYSLDWFTIDGGGGTSAGGSYSLSGTIGQHDAGAMSGGSYVLHGGFWAGIEAIQVSGQPMLHIRIEGSNVVLYWASDYTGFSVQRTGALGASGWQTLPDVPQSNGSTYEVQLPLQTGMQFYRLVR